MPSPAAVYAIAVEHLVDGGWRPLTEPWTQAFDCSSPDDIAAQVAEGWNLAELGHPWAVGVFRGVRFDDKLAELKG